MDVMIRYLEQLLPNLVIERFVSQSPPQLLIAPQWGLKNYEFTEKLCKRMREQHTFQGRRYEETSIC